VHVIHDMMQPDLSV